MAEFHISRGPAQPSDDNPPLLWWRHRDHVSDEEPRRLYEGPHGPLAVFSPDDRRATVVRGEPPFTPVRLEWGPRSRQDQHASRQLRRVGLSCVVDGVDVTFQSHFQGITRASRALRVRAGESRYVYRLRRIATNVVEREDGSLVVRFNRRRNGGWMDDGVDRVEVVLTLLVATSGLLLESSTLTP